MLGDATTSIVIAVAGILGGGSLVALFKVGPQRKHIVVDAAQGAVVVQSGVLKDLKDEIARLQAQVANLEMEKTATEEQLEAENESLEKRQRESEATVERLRMEVEFLHRDLDRHGRMTELARRRSHILSNAFSSLELRVHNLIDEMRKNDVPVPSELLPYEFSAQVQAELALLAELEGKITFSAATDPPVNQV